MSVDVYRAKDYAHDSGEPSETVEHLTDQFDWPEDVAEAFADNHRPGYEIGFEFTYNPETNECVIERVFIEDQVFTPARA